MNFRKESDDWGWSADNEWSDVKSTSGEKAKKTSGVAKKKIESKKNEDLLIDFGASSGAGNAKKQDSQNQDSWANWENDAWDSLNKKD